MPYGLCKKYGGWANGPQLEATGHFRTEKVDGKWWLVTPSGHLFYSLGINVVKIESDAANGNAHPEWYESAARSAMSFTTWNLREKFGKSGFDDDYYDLVLKRLDSWGINTIGNWSDGALTKLGRKPYVITTVSKPDALPYLEGGFYDTLDATFAAKMREAVSNALSTAGSALAKAATLKYAKIKGTKPAEYELVCDTSKGKTNLSGLKLTYTAKTSTIKGSFNVYTVNEAKHKVNKVSFTVKGMVIGGKAVGVATCKLDELLKYLNNFKKV